MDEIKHANQLLALAGEDFINAVYNAYLKRSPDRSGREHFLDRLRSGDGKLAIIAAVATSPEAQTMRTSLIGTDLLLKLFQDSKKGRWGDANRSTGLQLNLLEHSIGEAHGRIQSRLDWLQSALGDVQTAIAHMPVSHTGASSRVPSEPSLPGKPSQLKSSMKLKFNVDPAVDPDRFLNNLQSAILKTSESEAFQKI